MQGITKQFNKAMPYVERAIKWVVRTAFELLKLTGLAFTILHLVSAALIIEAVLTGVAVFASLYFTKFWK
jgi:hypothetical protein